MDEAIRPVRKGVLPAIGLFFLAPLIAEFLLGNLPIKMLPVILVLAPMYGGGALLIRELVRRAGLGWPSIVLLALAYGIVEEAYTTQSLFNPNYLKLNLHLLQPAYIPALGIGAWWTVFVLNLHTAWSVSTSIALVEAAVPDRAATPWLGRIGLVVTALLFALGAVVTTRYQLKQDSFVASHAQLLISGVIIVALIILGILLPRGSAAKSAGTVPNPWIIGGLALAAGSAILVAPTGSAILLRSKNWGWGAFALILVIDLCMIALVLFWSSRSGWDIRHKLALAGGAALAYGWHAFVGHPVVGGGVNLVRIGNAIFLLGAIALIAFAAKRTFAWVKETASA
jgi:hypothetical protein